MNIPMFDFANWRDCAKVLLLGTILSASVILLLIYADHVSIHPVLAMVGGLYLWVVGQLGPGLCMMSVIYFFEPPFTPAELAKG